MIKLGSNSIGKIYLGSNSIGKAYLGSNLVFQKGSSPTPPGPTPTPTFVDYIQTDGVAYINTGIKGNAPMSMIIEIMPVVASSTRYILGCRKDSGDTRFCFLLLSDDKKIGLAYMNGTYTSDIDVSASCDNQTFANIQAKMSSGSQTIYCKQEGESSFTSKSHSLSGTLTTNTDICLFSWNNQGTVYSTTAGTRVKRLRLYTDTSMSAAGKVFDGMACYYNGAYGLWDSISDSFFGNSASTGAFTGPQI